LKGSEGKGKSGKEGKKGGKKRGRSKEGEKEPKGRMAVFCIVLNVF
jgi:hypothetical protein